MAFYDVFIASTRNIQKKKRHQSMFSSSQKEKTRNGEREACLASWVRSRLVIGANIPGSVDSNEISTFHVDTVSLYHNLWHNCDILHFNCSSRNFTLFKKAAKNTIHQTKNGAKNRTNYEAWKTHRIKYKPWRAHDGQSENQRTHNSIRMLTSCLRA